MTKKISPLWIVLGVLALLVAIYGLAYVSANNTGNRFETSIEAEHENGKNILGQYAPRLKEALGVTRLQTDAVAKVITAANDSRYGDDGSKATMQWISEQNPNLDQASFQKVLNLIEAGRNDFQNAQKRKIDQIRAYKTALGNMPGSYFLRAAGYPTQQYVSANYGKIVISGHADDAFATGRDDGVNLNGL